MLRMQQKQYKFGNSHSIILEYRDALQDKNVTGGMLSDTFVREAWRPSILRKHTSGSLCRQNSITPHLLHGEDHFLVLG